MIYQFYVVSSYPSIASSRQFRKAFCLVSILVFLSKAGPFYLYLINILLILNKQNWSLHYNAENFLIIYAIRNKEQLGRKYKDYKLLGKMLHA